MQDIIVPVTDANSETALIAWFVEDGANVDRGQLIATAETSKSVIEIVAECGGFLLHEVPEGADVSIDSVIGRVFDDAAALEDHRRDRAPVMEPPSTNGDSAVRATRSAVELANAHGIELASLNGDGLLTSRDVEAALADSKHSQPAELPDPLVVDDGRRRLLVIGAGLGATQVIDILGHHDDVTAVAIVDDETTCWGDEVAGVPVVGGRDRIAELLDRGVVDAAVISISTSVQVRASMRAFCDQLDLPLANAIDPTARIATGVEMGLGNVLCAFCHLGVGAVVGHNNFLSAYNSFDHHSILGSDISTGPGCMTSGLVTIGDRARFGTGIFVEPKVHVGQDALIASGSVLLGDVPDGHVVKMKAGTTIMSPRRQ
ncbi:MAG TPA: biotin/lipoyl-containing protein [Microthrixaceae bacterium]|nr:biotin/lipoyl-containing protein [Microthrixaceae bacterium]